MIRNRGRAKRGEGGRIHSDLEPVDPENIENEDFPEEAEFTSEPPENGEDSDSTLDVDLKIE